MSARAALAAALALAALAAVEASEVNVTVRRAPYVVSSVSSKSERAWARCRYCGSKTGYDRTYRWDVYAHVWRETTADVPDVCRRCRAKLKDQEKLDRQERDLDRRIEYQRTKARIRDKKRTLEELRRH